MPDNSVFDRIFKKTFIDTDRSETVIRKKSGVEYLLKAIVTRLQYEEEHIENDLWVIKRVNVTFYKSDDTSIGVNNPSYDEVVTLDGEDYDVVGWQPDGVSSIKYMVKRDELVENRMF